MELTNNTIYTIKLNSGEELVAKFLEVDTIKHNGFPANHALVLDHPVSIGPGPNGALGLVPSMFTYNPENPVRLNTNSIAMIADTDEAVKAKYIQATTGIKVPDKKIILG